MAGQDSKSRSTRLVRFLRGQIGNCPGVVWEDQAQQMFRVPWKHLHNREWTPEYSQLFLEWAKHTDKYKEGDKIEYARWKTQLRCAMNKLP